MMTVKAVSMIMKEATASGRHDNQSRACDCHINIYCQVLQRQYNILQFSLIHIVITIMIVKRHVFIKRKGLNDSDKIFMKLNHISLLLLIVLHYRVGGCLPLLMISFSKFLMDTTHPERSYSKSTRLNTSWILISMRCQRTIIFGRWAYRWLRHRQTYVYVTKSATSTFVILLYCSKPNINHHVVCDSLLSCLMWHDNQHSYKIYDNIQPEWMSYMHHTSIYLNVQQISLLACIVNYPSIFIFRLFDSLI